LVETLTSVLRGVPLNPPCLGVGRLVVLERDPARRAAAGRLGADLIFDPEDQAQELRGFADERLGVFTDHVFDAFPHIERSTGLDTRSAGIHLLRAGGGYIISVPSTFRRVSMPGC